VSTAPVDVDVTDPVLTEASATVEDDAVTATVAASDNVAVAGVRAALLDSEREAVTEVDATETDLVPTAESGVWTAGFTGVANGTYTVRFTATDTSGNTGQATTAPVEVDVDVTNPTLTGPTASAEDDTITAS